MAVFNDLRIERVQQLLTSTDFGLKEVASLVAYKTQSEFCRTFRRVLGVSPGSYRQISTHTEQENRRGHSGEKQGE